MRITKSTEKRIYVVLFDVSIHILNSKSARLVEDKYLVFVALTIELARIFTCNTNERKTKRAADEYLFAPNI